MSIAAWRKFDAALKSFKREGRAARLWWRDDDAELVTPELERLAERAEKYGIPLSLAVIPVGASKDVRTILTRGEGWAALVHGFAHKNYAPLGEKRAEFGDHRPLQRMTGELRMGLDRLHAILPDHARPVLVPPWNRIAPALLPRLESIGFTGLSTFGPRLRRTPIPILNSHVDIMNWRVRRFAGADVVLERFIELLEAQRRAANDPGEPIGLLTHHRQHDRAAEQFLDRLVRHVAKSEGARWLSLDEVLAEVTSPGRFDTRGSFPGRRPATIIA